MSSNEALYQLLMMERFGGPTMAEYDRKRAYRSREMPEADLALAQQVLANEAHRHEHAILRAQLRKPPQRITSRRGWQKRA